MTQIKIHILHTGKVLVSPKLPFGGENSNIISASGIFTPKSKKIWLPVSVYLIEHPKGLILVDTGWSREMSPNGELDKKSQISHLGSRILYLINQGIVPEGMAVHEQLARLGYSPGDIDYVIMTHLDCDHASGLVHVKDAKNILVAREEIEFTKKERIRYNKKWWKDVTLETFSWNGEEGPVNKSYDLFGDGSVVLINVPGHADGLVAVKITNNDKFVLLATDAGYAEKSWQQLILPGISSDKVKQKLSLQWVKEQSEKKNCLKVIANHDTNIEPQVIVI